MATFLFLMIIGEKRDATENFHLITCCIQEFVVTLPSKMAKLLCLGKKKNKFFCFALDF